MACNNPLKGYFSKEVNVSGKRSIVFDVNNAIDDMSIDLPCGQCIACKISKNGEWALRMMHEASCHKENSFITLTYSDEVLFERDNPHTLVKKDAQKFIKDLRYRLKAEAKKNGTEVPKFKYFIVGEYGDKSKRVHLHAIIFGYAWNDDRELHHISNGNELYSSEALEKVWGKGNCLIGGVDKESCGYCAGYTTKKINGDMAEEHYVHVNDNGEVFKIIPEFCMMSTKTPIGYEWYLKYGSDTKKDFITNKGKKFKIPKLYDRMLEKLDPIDFDDVKEKREVSMRTEQCIRENRPERLKVKEAVLKRKQKQYEDIKGGAL